MLTPEQAKARIEEWCLPEDENRLRDEVARLPDKLRKLAEDTFALTKEADEDVGKPDRQSQAILTLDRQTSSERRKVFATISPKLAPAMEQTWQFLKTTPYRHSYRAPQHPELALNNIKFYIPRISQLGARFPAEILTLDWLATWASHLHHGHFFNGSCLGTLFAAVLHQRNDSSEAVFEILRQSLTNQHEIGAAGYHVYTAFLSSNRPEAWELIEKTLLAAQRQEGLRNMILVAVEGAHPEAFRRVLGLVLEKDLLRFSSVHRAASNWIGWPSLATGGGVIRDLLAQTLDLLENPQARKKALMGSDAQSASLALWCEATEDAPASVGPAMKMLNAKSAAIRFAGATHLLDLDLDEATDAVVPSLDDEDLRVAHSVLLGLVGDRRRHERLTGCFERMERLVARTPEKPRTLEPIVWPWTEVTVQRSRTATCLLHFHGQRPANRLLPYLPMVDSDARTALVFRIVDCEIWDTATRETILRLAGDTVVSIRTACLKALQERGVLAKEIVPLEGYLTRKAGDLRLSVLNLLLKQDDDAVLASARRLLGSTDANQRLGGLELLRRISEAKRCPSQCRELANAYRATNKRIGKLEQSHLDEIAKEKFAVATLDDALGLMDPNDRTPVTAPRNLKVPFFTSAAAACLKSLDELIHEHRNSPIQFKDKTGAIDHVLLGTFIWWFPTPNHAKSRDTQLPPLADIWLDWRNQRSDDLRDPDGLELLRALIWGTFANEWQYTYWKTWAQRSPGRRRVAAAFSGGNEPPKLRYPLVTLSVLNWLLFLLPTDDSDYLLDAIETAFALAPTDDLAKLKPAAEGATGQSREHDDDDQADWRSVEGFEIWEKALLEHVERSGRKLTPARIARYWRLMHWRSQPVAGAPRQHMNVELLLDAHDLKAANLADVADHLLGPRGTVRYGDDPFDLLNVVTDRKPSRRIKTWLETHPEARDLIQRAVARILDLELNRGDSPTAATAPAHSIQALMGIETLRRILHAIGRADFKIGRSWQVDGEQDRRRTLTRLAKVTYPADGETAKDFCRIMKTAVKAGEFPEARLLQLIFLAPQWTKHVEAYLAWPQMSEGVYWFLAHMRGIYGLWEQVAETVTDETRDVSADDSEDGESDAETSAWERLIRERTPLTDTERREGAIDVAWFQSTHEALGEKRWQQLAAAARFASTPAQAKRARFIADVLLCKVNRQELISGIKKKQLKDHVRLLGLLPLAKGTKRAADLLERWRVLREYCRYANKLSGLSKPAALRAWEIGMKNLAQTAGFTDPLRLEWSLGADEVKDLSNGPVQVSKSGVTVTLAIDDFSRPSVGIQKGDKSLKSMPPALKKDKQVAALVHRAADLKKHATAIRQSLESAMCRGDRFTGMELRQWHDHALLAPLLARLIVVGEGILGYPDRGGKALRDFRGKLEPVKAAENMRFAHPHDLLEAGNWHEWQSECFKSERIQPFKQVFRELYVVTSQERKDGGISGRYNGQQIQSKQAMALFGSRGWGTRDGVFKVFHDDGLTASVDFTCGVITLLEVENATLDGVRFTKRDDWLPVPLKSVPPRLFSEVMRDLDLVVSVAHAGGVDPEASASTVEMRAGLLRETCSLLKLKNVRLKSSHALIDGELGNYSVHLGSGVVHKMPGGSLCIVPVHAQDRGRLFLPFADDDPRTAEVVSKVLLLARDREIQDPVILGQIRR